MNFQTFKSLGATEVDINLSNIVNIVDLGPMCKFVGHAGNFMVSQSLGELQKTLSDNFILLHAAGTKNLFNFDQVAGFMSEGEETKVVTTLAPFYVTESVAKIREKLVQAGQQGLAEGLNRPSAKQKFFHENGPVQ